MKWSDWNVRQLVAPKKGERRLTMAEMVAIAEALGRPLGFFVNDPLPAVVNRRRDLANAPEDARHDTTEALDTEIELFAADALMLLEMGLLAPVKRDREARTPQGHEEAEHLASAVRDSLGGQETSQYLILVRLASNSACIPMPLP